MKKRVAVLGSTGSIGKQTLSVIDFHSHLFSVEILTANDNYKLLIEQALKYKPNVVIIGNKNHYGVVNEALKELDIKVYAGHESVAQIVELDSIDIVVVGIIGISAILPLISALKANKTIALANKESIVVAGNLIKKYAIESKGSIIPVDSEHSAIFQSLVGEAGNRLKKITLTASGGPFLEKDFGDFVNITSDEAIRHPNWDMGKKVSVDSATLMNKGLEAIEAHWLFDIEIENIEIIIHPQSVIHSMVHFVDGTVKTLMSIPDMRIPIQYALSYPNRIESTTREFNITEISKLEFRKPDQKKFRNLALAFEAMKSGGNMPCILNAANDAAVGAFLSNHIGFLDIHDIIEETMNSVHYITEPSLEEYFETDRIARIKAYELINKIN